MKDEQEELDRCDLEADMTIFSSVMQRDELLDGKSDEFENGFVEGYRLCSSMYGDSNYFDGLIEGYKFRKELLHEIARIYLSNGGER